MSTSVTVAVVKPNHLPVKVFVEQKNGSQWSPEGPGTTVPLGGAETFLVHSHRRLVIEEIPE